MHTITKTVLATSAALALTGCASPSYNQGYYPQQSGAYGGGYQQQGQYGGQYQGQYQTLGTISNVEYIANNDTGAGNVVGMAAGGAVGGLAGHQVGKGRGRTAATVVGAIAGAMLGNAMANDAARNSGAPYWRVSVQLDGGGMRQFNYANNPNVQLGERVRVEGDQLYRQ